MKANEEIDLSKMPKPGCNKCGASTRSMFYETMKDDSDGHVCKPEPKTRTTIGEILLIILFLGISLMLVVSILLVIVYIRGFE